MAGRTVDEVWAYVHEYVALPYGAKKRWLEREGISRYTMDRWRATVFDGDLDRGLVPREGTGMTSPRRAHAYEKKRAQERAAQDAEIARLQERVRQLEASNDVLGKAIGLLHAMSEPEPEQDEPTTPDASTDSSS